MESAKKKILVCLGSARGCLPCNDSPHRTIWARIGSPHSRLCIYAVGPADLRCICARFRRDSRSSHQRACITVERCSVRGSRLALLVDCQTVALTGRSVAFC